MSTTDEMNAWIRGQRTIPTFQGVPEPEPGADVINAEIRRVAGRTIEDEKEQAA